MPKEPHHYGYGKDKAFFLDNIEDAKLRYVLTATINPEITRGMLLPNKHNKQGWWIEIPDLPDINYFMRAMRNLIDGAESVVHPEFMTQNVAVRFVPDIFLKDRATGKVVEASGQSLGLFPARIDNEFKFFIEVSLSALKTKVQDQRRHWISFAIRTIFHEVFENEYNMRMQQSLLPKTQKVSEFDSNYVNAPHEQYATNNANKLIFTVFGDAPPEFREIAFGSATEKQIKVQTRAMNHLASAILRFLAEQK